MPTLLGKYHLGDRKYTGTCGFFDRKYQFYRFWTDSASFYRFFIGSTSFTDFGQEVPVLTCYLTGNTVTVLTATVFDRSKCRYPPILDRNWWIFPILDRKCWVYGFLTVMKYPFKPIVYRKYQYSRSLARTYPNLWIFDRHVVTFLAVFWTGRERVNSNFLNCDCFLNLKNKQFL